MRGFTAKKTGFLTTILLLIILFPVRGMAMPIDPGFDLFSTPDGSAIIDLGGILGVVPFESDPIGPGNTDTIVERLTGLPDGGTGTIEIELVALSLQSVDPVGVGGVFFDIDIILDDTAPSLGQINILTHDSTGGTYNSFIDIFVEIIFTEVGNPLNMITNLFDFTATTTGSRWSHTPSPDYPVDPSYPSGNFYAGILDQTGPHRTLVPSVIPLPAAFPLFAGALFLMGLRGWRRKQTAS
ncbi:hypothetical protein A9Q83_12655 [Alphaproteobacteria bacterium 46_93_T64]|nr:hypothetical protein A9Q83_12655 [Alphaproteobacteria bacterium 46_93_T64]